MKFLDGFKTYLVAALAIGAALVDVLDGSMTWGQFLDAILPWLGVAGFRSALKKVV